MCISLGCLVMRTVLKASGLVVQELPQQAQLAWLATVCRPGSIPLLSMRLPRLLPRRFGPSADVTLQENNEK